LKSLLKGVDLEKGNEDKWAHLLIMFEKQNQKRAKNCTIRYGRAQPAYQIRETMSRTNSVVLKNRTAWGIFN
jgi:hypothetical protein